MDDGSDPGSGACFCCCVNLIPAILDCVNSLVRVTTAFFLRSFTLLNVSLSRAVLRLLQVFASGR